jgi:hypothetical protein
MGYLDPGLFGMISQIGLAIFLLVVSVFAFFFRPVKAFFLKVFKKDNKESAGSIDPVGSVNPAGSPDPAAPGSTNSPTHDA